MLRGAWAVKEKEAGLREESRTMGVARTVIFLGVVSVILTVLYGYPGWRLIGGFELQGSAAVFAWVGLVTLMALPLLSYIPRMLLPRMPFQQALAWAGYSSLGFFLMLLPLTLIRDIAWFGFKAITAISPELQPAPETTAALLVFSNWSVPVGAVLLTGLGMYSARKGPRILRVKVPVPNLHPDLEGFRIVQLSDVHIGPTIKRGFLEKVVARANALEPDMTALTGDLVDGSVLQLREHTSAFGDLRAKHGVFFVTGNHEYYAGARAWVQEFRRLGIDALMNEHRLIRRGDATLLLGGVTDYEAGRFYPEEASNPMAALQGASGADYKILLAHQPRSVFAAEKAGFDLQISGHTHGGQFWPITHFVRLQQPFREGLRRLRETQIYISRGTGYWGPPIRVGAPSEITELELTVKR